MGAYNYISDSIWLRLERRRLANILAGAVLIALIGPSPSLAAEPEAGLSNRSVVSTSPVDLAEPDSTQQQPTATRSVNGPPLTRAASQLRIKEMSPTRWLAQFGNVSIGPLD